MALAPGTRLGTYEIAVPLGAGGMGEVYRARDLRLGREVALKVLPADVAAHPDRLARFEREARAVAGLNHPNILTTQRRARLTNEVAMREARRIGLVETVPRSSARSGW